MENKIEIKLIDGVFTPSEAQTLLTTLIDNKINYHKIDDFSNHIRYDRDSQHSKQRILELVETKTALRAWIDLVQKDSSRFIVKSTVTIEFDENILQS